MPRVENISKHEKSRTHRPKIEGGKLGWVVVVFVIALLIPLQINIGPVRLSPYRLLLLFSIIPSIVYITTRRDIDLRADDTLVMLFALSGSATLVIVDGLSNAFESAGIFFVETAGAYLLARCCIRHPSTFELMAQSLFLGTVILIPFAAIEAVTGRPVILDALGKIFTVFPNIPHETRWGLDRAQVVFEHPILFGVFCVTSFSLSMYVLCHNKGTLCSVTRAILVGIASFFSLSSGALVALFVQLGLTFWDVASRRLPRRWIILGVAVAVAYLIVDVASNRTPVQVFISYLTFNSHTASMRIHIWNYGFATALQNPLFGIGLTGDWERPSWLGGSVDNFWLLIAMRHGFPVAAILGIAVLVSFFSLSKVKLDDSRLRAYRTGLLVTLIGLVVAGSTVHYWNATYCLLFFLLGSGRWLTGPAANDDKYTLSPISPGVRSRSKTILQRRSDLARPASGGPRRE